MTNPMLEILVALGIDNDKSRANINNYISKLKGLEKVKVELEVGGIGNAQQAIEKLNNSTKNNNKVKFDTSKATEDINAVQVSLDRLKAETNGKNGTLKISTDTKGVITQITQSFTNAKNEVEKIKFKPIVDLDGNQMFQQMGAVTSNVVNKDALKAMEEFNRELDKLHRKGSISSADKNKFLIDSEAIKHNVTDIKKLQQELKNLGESTSFSSKITNANNRLIDSFASLSEKMNSTVGKLGSNIDTSKLDVIRVKMDQLSNVQIMNESDIQKANTLIDSLNRRITVLSTSGNGMERFNNTIHEATEALDKMEREGYTASHAIEALKQKLNSVQTGNLQQAKDALKAINTEMQNTSANNGMLKGTRDIQLSILRLNSDLEKTANLYKRSINPADLDALRSKINALSRLPLMNLSNITEAKHEIAQVREHIKRFNADVTTATRNSMGLFDSLRTAFEKFPIWMLASTMFYSTIRGIKDLTDKVIELDTALTNLERVSSGEQFEFDQVIERSVNNVSELSGKMGDYMTLLSEYARTGKTIDQSFDLADTTQMLQNISDLTAEESVNSLTAAMISFGIAAEDSARIADKLNEVDNNFAITTKDLSQALNKASSTAKTFNVSMDEMLGHVTAIGSATRESGNIVGNSLKTIYARLTNNKNAIGALEGIGVSINDVNGDVRSASDIIDEVAKKWGTLSDAQRQNTAVGAAGIYQLSRWNALMLNYDTAIKATETSMNSYNSAAREQEKYNESLEARINRLNTAWYSFANTVGENGLYDTIVVGTKALELMTGAAESGVSVFNMYSATLGIAGLGLTLLSTRFASVAGAVATLMKAKVKGNATTAQAAAIQGRYTMTLASTDAVVRKLTISKTAYQAKLAGVTASSTAATAATVTLSAAMRTLFLASGVGVAFVVAGVAIEKIVSHLSKATQETEKFEQYLKKNKEALTDNKEEVDKLIRSFDMLSKQKDGNSWNTEKEEEYLDVQNRLGELFPSIIDYVDAKGNAHIKSKDAINREIEAVNKLIQAEKDLQVAQAEDTFKEAGKEVSSIAKQKEGLEATLELKIDRGASQKEIAKLELEILQLEQRVADETAEIRHNVMLIADAFLEVGQTINDTVDKQINDALQNIDFSKLNPQELKDFSEELSNIAVAMSLAFEKEDGASFDSANAELTSLLTSMDLIPDKANNVIGAFDDLVKAMEAVPVLKPLDESMHEVGDSSVALAKKIEDLIEKAFELKSVQEQLSGVSDHHIQSSNALLLMYDHLTLSMGNYTDAQLKELLNKERLTAEEKSVVKAMLKRDQVLQQLMVLYPQYAQLQREAISLTDEQIEAMKREEKANKILQDAYGLLSEGKLTAEQEMTLIAVNETKNRIETLKAEIRALSSYFTVYAQLMDKYRTEGAKALSVSEQLAMARTGYLSVNNPNGDIIGDKTTELDKQLEMFDSQIGGIDTFVSSVKKAEESTKSSAKSTKESIYVTDEYKQAMEELNLAIEKQQKLQNQFPTHSASYRKAIEAEIKLQKEKLNLMNAQATALDKQIKSGKIKQTGNIALDDDSSKSTTSIATKPSGWGKITSGYRAKESFRKNPHTGIDLASKYGTRLDSNISGTVIKTGKTDLSGNYVKVRDDKGLEHFYGHLSKITVVVDDIVKAGQQLGNIGNTGNVVAGKGGDGSHLHYQISDSKGNLVDPTSYAKAAKTMIVSANQTSGAVSNTKQSIDDAKSALVGLQGEIVNQTDLIEQLEHAIVESYLEGFEHRRGVIDAHYAHEEAKLKNVNRASSQYNKTIDGMNNLLERKQKANQDELNYINELIAKGGLSAKTLEDMNSRTLALKTSIQALNNEMGQLKFDQIVDKFDDSIKKQDHVLAYESVKIDELDKNSTRYVATLDKMNTHINRKLELTKADIAETNKLINSGKYSGEVLESMKDRVQELTTSLKELAHEIANNNYEVVVNIHTRSNEIADDLQFEIDRSKAIQGLYKEGSADATNEIQKQISLYEQMAKQHDETRRKLQAELTQRDLLPEQIKEITELMEDETNAYLGAKTSIDSLTKSIEETNKRLREEIANKLINAYKEYVGERRDEHLKVLEDELDAEQKRHDKLKKMWQDELDLFRKNIEERLKMIDRTEASRSYQMDIDDMESERKKVVDKINLLSIDNSHEAKSKTKKLKEELDKIDKDLAEKRHQRDIELQKQSLSDMLEQKEDDNSNREELEDERLQTVVDRIEREKKYWEKHYNDLLNDERKFAQIREDIMNGHFDKVLAEFEGYISQMEATMPRLADTMDGTMQAVGTAIRQNVIDNLREAMNSINEFNAMQIATNSITDDFNPNASKDNSYIGNTGAQPTTPSPSQPPSSNNQSNKGQAYTSLNKGDLQVLLGKFINDVVAPTFKAETKERIALKSEGLRLGELGRSNSSQIPVNSAFGNEIGKLTSTQIDQLKNFIQSNAGSILGGNYTSAFNKNLASLDTGGFINSSGGGMDGKGGKLSLLHPKEVVFDKLDTKRLFQNIEVSDSLSKSLAAMTSSFASIFKGMSPTFATGSGATAEHYHIQFGDVHNATQAGAKDFARQIITDIKLQKGGRR